MTANFDQEADKNHRLQRIIILIEIIIIIIPALILFYVIHSNQTILPVSEFLLLCFTFLLIISGIFILRNVINRFISILLAIKTADSEGTFNLNIKQDVVELREVSNSLSNIMIKFNKTAADLNKCTYELLALKELIEIAKKSLDIRRLQELVLDKIMTVTGARIGSFLEYEAPFHQFRIAAIRGISEDNLINFHIPLEKTLAKYAVLEKKSVLIKDIQMDSRTNRINDSRYGSPSFLSIPVVLENDVSAVVNLAGKPPDDFFDEDDERICRLMIDEIDFALNNARLHFKVQELLKESGENNNRLQEEISKRKESEEQLFHYQKNLEHMIEERTKELVEINIKLSQEITERKLTQEALQESEEKMRTIIDSAKDWIFIKDREGRYALVNRQMATDLRKPESDMIGKTTEELCLSPELMLIDENDPVIFNGAITEFETTLPIYNQQKIFYIIKVPVRDKSGHIIALCGISRDITERKRMEAQLVQAEKMEALGNMAGGVAHDMNNVLGALVGYSELFLKKIDKDNPLKAYANSIMKSSKRGAAIIQDLLTLARRGVAVSEVVELNKIIGDYFETPEFEKLKLSYPNINFRMDLAKDIYNIKGSPVHLGKTIMNLISNAAEAITNSGEVRIQTANRYIDTPVNGHETMRPGSYVVMTVSDNGMGIPARDIGKIFEPFYTKKVMGRSGTGLGLAVVWGTVNDHNGYIDVQSEENMGSVFTIYFPATTEEVAVTESEPALEEYMGRGESILVVDDIIEQRDLAINMLNKLGYQPTAVCSGEEAVEYVKNKKTDLIMLDMIMDPGINGLETYERVLKINPDQKAVIVSGFSETEQVSKARSLGAGSYVSKPYVLEKIGLAIRKELDAKK
ncbi:MAG: Blue-light-activated protein [Smithella sp. PtaU1.Bin162]|nr:MAG: Blue-light-activated protein [Smithella sp. PtaU1.Bin162]